MVFCPSGVTRVRAIGAADGKSVGSGIREGGVQWSRGTQIQDAIIRPEGYFCCGEHLRGNTIAGGDGVSMPIGEDGDGCSGCSGRRKELPGAAETASSISS